MKINLRLPAILISFALLFVLSCSAPQEQSSAEETPEPSWPYAVTYEIFVQSYYDSNGDGIGDINGLTSKLDYLQDLGVEGVWLMPIMPSPSYHKYDVTDYQNIHPDYGTIEDFKNFTAEAHKRDINVVVDFIINHTDKTYPWFLESKKGPMLTLENGEQVPNDYREFYVWKTREEIEASGTFAKEAQGDSDNIIQWYEVDGQDEMYYGYFGSHMPDLNFSNPIVKQKVFEIGQWWLTEMGVDGFRLDAAKHIFDDFPKDEYPAMNHEFWVEFREAMEEVKPDVYLVGEVWADAETVAPYLKGLPASFNFDMGDAIEMAVRSGSDSTLVARYKEISEYYQSITDDYIDATFLRNHDQNRILSNLNINKSKGSLAASILLTLPGSPYLYYGEEIGMLGMKPDEYIREPFIWGDEGEDPGQTTWEEPRHSNSETVVSLSQQIDDPGSIYNHYKRLIKQRKGSAAMTYGGIDFSGIEDDELISFIRSHEEESKLVIHNLSPGEKSVELPESAGDVYFTSDENNSISGGTLNLQAYGSVVINLK